MLHQDAVLVNSTIGTGRNEVHQRLVNGKYGIQIEQSPDGEGNWRCQAVINLDAALEFARNLISLVETTASPEPDLDAEYAYWIRREEEKRDAVHDATRAHFAHD